jgi:hypothetical protein
MWCVNMIRTFNGLVRRKAWVEESPVIAVFFGMGGWHERFTHQASVTAFNSRNIIVELNGMHHGVAWNWKN